MRLFGVSADYTEPVVCKSPESVVGKELVTRMVEVKGVRKQILDTCRAHRETLPWSIKMQRQDRDTTHNLKQLQRTNNISNQIRH